MNNAINSRLDLNRVVESIRDPFCIIRMDHIIVRVNKAYLEHKGKEESELVGKICYKALYNRDRICEDCVVEKAFISGDPCAKEKHVTLPDGSEEWYEIYTYPIISEDGTTSHVIEYVRDITERKRTEHIMKTLLKDLENANKELKDFAYIVSHDLKAPLRAISSIASWLASDYKDKFGEDGREYLEILLQRVRRMDRLINGILQYSRVGHKSEERVEIDLNRLLNEVIDTLSPPENIEIRINDELPVICADETRIGQVFQNLLSNAIQYMDKPKGEIRIGCVREGDYWRFSITDNGRGIEERFFDKIFQIFQTLESRDESRGTGVGLAVVKKIIEMYGGRIWVESELGKGSTFYFTFPLQRGERDEIQYTDHDC